MHPDDCAFSKCIVNKIICGYGAIGFYHRQANILSFELYVASVALLTWRHAGAWTWSLPPPPTSIFDYASRRMCGCTLSNPQADDNYTPYFTRCVLFVKRQRELEKMRKSAPQLLSQVRRGFLTRASTLLPVCSWVVWCSMCMLMCEGEDSVHRHLVLLCLMSNP